MIYIKGSAYKTTVDAAKELGVSTKTLRAYIKKGIVPRPPIITYGVRIMTHFPDDYLSKAQKYLEKYRAEKIVNNF